MTGSFSSLFFSPYPMNHSLLHHLSGFVTPQRLAVFEKVLSFRTRYISVVLEDIYQSHNASAVLRSCDCFGIQDVHIIENRNEYILNTEVSMGADKWLSMQKYNSEENNSLRAIQHLRDRGYRIVATTPHTDDVLLTDFPLEKGKIALFFGTELRGLSSTVLDHADEYLRIPMFGFTESFNISVSAALILQVLSTKLHRSDINWNLTKDEVSELKLEWLRKTIKKVSLIEEKFHAAGK